MRNHTVKTGNNRDGHHLCTASTVLAILFFCTSAFIAATHATGSQLSASGVVAIPAPTPEKWPGKLGRNDISRLADELRAVLDNVIEDEQDVDRIVAKWEARKLAGKTKAEVLDLYFVDVKAIVKDPKMEDQIWERWTVPEVGDQDEPGGIWVKVVHDGAYIAHFTVTWDEPGKPNRSATESGKMKGFETTFKFPENATNIRLKMENDTGLAWQPRREIFNRALSRAGFNVCYKIAGTTLGSTYDTSCTEGKRGDIGQDDTDLGTRPWIKIVHSGAFTADFQILWDEPGKPNQSWKETGKTSGFQATFEIPINATNIRLKMTNDTGLAWEPKRVILDKTFVLADINKCYQVKGTTLASAYDNNCP